MIPDVRATWEQNWPYMLIAFALALALWLGVSAEGPTQQEIRVPLTVHNLDPRYVMTSRPPDRVEVIFRGPARDLVQLALGWEKPRLVYTVDAVRSRVQDVLLTPEMVAVPEGVEAQPVDVRNGQVVLRFEPALERRVRVTPRVEATAAPGFDLAGPITVEPERVVIRGAESAVRATDSLWTVPLRLEALQESVVREVEIERPDVESPLDLSVETVRIEVPVETVAEVILEDVPVRLVGVGERALAARPSAVDVTLRGPVSRVARLTAQEVDAFVRVDGDGPAEGWRTVEVAVSDPYVRAAVRDSVRVVPRRAS